MSRGSWNGISQPDPDRRQIDGALVDELAFVIAGRDSAELPELAEAALDSVALFVTCPVKSERPTARTAPAAAVSFLLFLHRDEIYTEVPSAATRDALKRLGQWLGS